MLLNPARFAVVGGGGGNWNAAASGAGIALSNSDKTATRSAGNNTVTIATIDKKTTGKYYWEVHVGLIKNFFYIGVLRTGAFNPALSSADLGASTGTASYENGGAKYINTTYTGTWGSTYTTGDVIGVAMDIGTGNIWFSKNNTWQASGNPAAGTNQAGTISSPSSGIQPAVTVGTSTNYGGVCTARFAAADQTYSPPSGFSSWN